MRWRAMGSSLLLLMAPLAAQAATLSVSPVRLTLSAAHPTGVLQVSNKAGDSELVQVQLAAWSQKNGRDVFARTRNVLATPPIFRLDGGGTQVIRVGLRVPPAPGKEMTYRLFMTQVPPAPKPGVLGLQFALRISLPIFVLPATHTAPALHWDARLVSPTKLMLSATNAGTAHVQILSLTLGVPGLDKPLPHKSGNYILPGATAHWGFDLKSAVAAGAGLTVSVKTDQGDFDATVAAEK